MELVVAAARQLPREREREREEWSYTLHDFYPNLRNTRVHCNYNNGSCFTEQRMLLSPNMKSCENAETKYPQHSVQYPCLPFLGPCILFPCI